MNIKASTALVIATVGITLAVSKYYKPAEVVDADIGQAKTEASRDLASAKDVMVAKIDSLATVMEERKGSRDKEVAGIKEDVSEIKTDARETRRIMLEEFKHINDTLNDYVRSNEERVEAARNYPYAPGT